ncbi:MAG: hypothetical protein KC492_19190 [Myxococcales bacterium]|nr:hypothetical protein [Myxococcales bacterium]
MADVVAAYLDEQELGRPLARVELKGKLAPNQSAKRVVLCRTTKGLWLVAASSRKDGRYLDVLARSALSYRVGRVADYLDLGGLAFRIPAGRGAEAREQIRLARLTRDANDAPPAQLDFTAGELVPSVNEEERLALQSRLEPQELLLAWLPTATNIAIRSPVLEDAEGTAHFLLTDQRAALIAISSVGDIKLENVERGRLEILEKGRELTLRSAHNEWKIANSQKRHYAALERAFQTIGDQRILRVAQAEWELSNRSSAPRSERLLRHLKKEGTHTNRLEASVALGFLELARDRPFEVQDLATSLTAAPAEFEVAARIWRGWEFNVESARALLAQLDRSQARLAPWALALHREVHRSVLKAHKARDDQDQPALADVELAQHLLDAGEGREAEALLSARLERLPSEELDDLLPAPDADLTRGAGGQTVHIRLYELLARARENTPEAAEAIAELARLQPLVPARLRALSASAGASLAARSNDALECLGPGGLAPGDRTETVEVLALPRHLVEGVLPHPLARTGSALVSRLQSLLAQVEVPDLGVLRDYCERISSKETDASRALQAASTALGIAGVEGYISRGKKSIGTRAYEGSPSFVLVGGRHLETDPAFRLSPLELRFALGAEVAHLRYEHTRVTSSELWAGALDAGKQSLDLALGVLPFLRGIGVAGRIGQLARRFQMEDVQKVISGARAVDRLRTSYITGKPPAPEPEVDTSVITAPNEALIAAHRVMQLTADRAGLVLAGDLRAALRAMFLVRPDFRAELNSVEQHGLADVLGRRTEDGSMAYQDLAVRIAALITFYLSEDYARLRGALTGRSNLVPQLTQ